MIRPIEILDFVIKFRIVVKPIADIYDQIMRIVLFIEILSHIRYAVSINFLQQRASRKGHSDDSFGYIGEI